MLREAGPHLSKQCTPPVRDVDVRIADIWAAAQRADYQFEVARWRDGEPVTELVGCHELTADDVADLSPTERAIYDRERARWAGVEAACEWLAREALLDEVDASGAYRDGETCVHGQESDESTERECELTEAVLVEREIDEAAE